MTDKFNEKRMLQDLLSLTRKVTPTMIANDIISVQPMTAPTGQIFTLRTRYGGDRHFELVDDKFTQEGWLLIDVSITVADWIITNPVDQWIAVESHKEPRYRVTEELMTLLILTF